MTLPQSGVVIHAGNVYLNSFAPGELVGLDEHAEEARRVLVDDARIEQWRRELLDDLSNAEYFRTELRKALDLAEAVAAAYTDSELVGLAAYRLIRGGLDREAVDRASRAVENFPEDWTAEDLARAVRSALNPLSKPGSVVTATMPAVTPAAEGAEGTAEQPAAPPAPSGVHQLPQEPALAQLTVRDNLFTTS